MSEETFTDPWWVKEWLPLMESSWQANPRLQAGLSLFCSGSVKRVTVAKGRVEAHIENVASDVCEVFLQVKEKEWEPLVASLLQSPATAVQVLSGDLPQDIHILCQQINMAWLPSLSEDTVAVCSCCPKLSVCEHVIASWYAFTEQWKEEPLLLLTVQGFDKEELLARLVQEWTGQNNSSEAVPSGEIRKTHTHPKHLDKQESTLELPPAETGYTALRRAYEQGVFWQAGEPFFSIGIDLDPEVISPDSLPLTWGTPAFAGKRGDLVTAYLCSVMRDVSQRARQQMAEWKTSRS